MRSSPVAFILLLVAIEVSAQKIPEPPQDAVSLVASLRTHAQPTVLSWITNQAATATTAKTDAAALDASVRTAIGSRFSGQKVSKSQADALVLMVMIETITAAVADARTLLARLESVRTEKDKLRDVQARLKRVVDSTAGDKSSEPCRVLPCTGLRKTLSVLSASQTRAGIPSPVVPRDAATLGELRVALKELDSEQDSIGELTQEMSLRLQEMMDRYAKYDAAVSAMMKAFASTQLAIIQNLK